MCRKINGDAVLEGAPFPATSSAAQPVFMWCRKLVIGVHHACWLLLQALFMTARTRPTMKAIAMRIINIAASAASAKAAEFSSVQNEPAVNALNSRRLIDAQIARFGGPQ